MTEYYDFIIVGGGTAGCLLANRLAAVKKKPSVLLIEKGEDGDVDHRVPYARYSNFFTRPDLDHAYVTTPLMAVANQVVPYARGKGLGGCSMINFMVYTRGAADDYNHWAKLTESKDWSWDIVKTRFKKIERYIQKIPDELKPYANPEPDAYGTNGDLDISVPFEGNTTALLDAAFDFGYKKNLNANNGDPIGIGVSAATSFDGMRTTSASAHIVSGTPNLTIMVQSQATKILFDGTKATGVQINGTKTAYASKEVILCAGAIDSPKLLLLSGVGPAKELQALNIDVVRDLPGVGKNFQDHCGVFTSDLIADSICSRTSFINSKEEIEKAQKQWNEDRSGPLTVHYGSMCTAFLKEPSLYETSEFKSLDEATQNYIRSPTVPSYEIAFNGPVFPPQFVFEDPTTTCFTTAIILMNPQSRGSVTLKSTNPEEPPVVDTAYLTHPYDKVALIEAIRQSRKFLKTSALGKYWKDPIIAPADESDEAIWAHILGLITPMWHASSTITMGKLGHPDTCVDKDLKVCGLESIRVADMSVCPLTISGHTQAVAYLIAQTVAEKIVVDHELE